MKYVYVLTSSENDIYYEQFLLSLTSMRIYNPDAEVIALIDNTTKKNLTGKRSGYEKLVSEIKLINVPDEYSQKEASRWIKTSIHHHVPGEFLYIDCDTIIAENLDCNFSSNIDIGAVLDTHITLENHHFRDNFQKEDLNAGFSSSLKTNRRYNGGLILFRDNVNASNFFEKWHSLWIDGRKRGCSQDMPSLNQANYEMGNVITELDGWWNCQISHNGLPYLQNAKVIHYFATSLASFDPAFIPASNNTFFSIKAEGVIPDELMKLLENPKSAFTERTRIVADSAAFDIIESSYFSKLLWLRKNHKRTFFLFDKIISGIKKPGG